MCNYHVYKENNVFKSLDKLTKWFLQKITQIVYFFINNGKLYLR